MSQGGIALNLDVFFDPIPHILSLESIFRQNEPDLISCVYDEAGELKLYHSTDDTDLIS